MDNAAFFAAPAVRDLAEEIWAHLEEKIEELIAAGLSRPEAIKAAHRECGNVGLIEQQGREVCDG